MILRLVKKLSRFLVELMSYNELQPVSYTYRPITDEGYCVEYSAVVNDGSYQIVVKVEGDNVDFTDSPEMLLKFFDGTVIYLHGERLDVSGDNGEIVPNSNDVETASFAAAARFPIRGRDIIQLKMGVRYVRITTYPFKHERTFDSDVIGDALYRQFLRLNNAW